MAMANRDEDIDGLSEQLEHQANISWPPGIKKLKKKIKNLDFIAENFKVERIKIGNYLQDAKNKVLFLGEGNFTFSAAVASFRGTWNNIIPSELCLTEDKKDYNKMFRKMIVEMAAHKDTKDTKFRGYVAALVGLKDADWKPIQVDAVNLKEGWPDGSPKPNALFFQCPFSHNVPTLISGFFESATAFQENGNLLFLSICSEYSDRYKLKVAYKGYKLLGVDDSFCKKMFVRGYKHQVGYNSDGHPRELGTDQLDSFVTLCYIRQEHRSRNEL